MGSARQVCQTSGFSHTAATGLPAARQASRAAPQRAAGLSAFVGHHRHSENIGQQLGPERTAGAPPPTSEHCAIGVPLSFNACSRR